MRLLLRTLICCAISFLYLSFFNNKLNAQTNVLTQHNNVFRTGWNNNETILNTSNVTLGSFGLLYSRAVDDQIYAQMLVVTNLNIPGYGIKNVIYVATVNNTIYAFDADDSNVTSPYWQVNLTVPGLRPPKNTDETGACYGNYKDFSGNFGIVGTPVIDTTTNTMYVVARSTASTTAGYVQYLHALDITTGAEKPNSPVLITAQYAGNGEGSSGGILTFDPRKQNQRGGLLLLNGVVYIPFSSHCDWTPYHGWILGYDKTTLTQVTVYNDTPDGYNGGIWMSGAGPSADSLGNIYVSTGNGTAGFGGNMNNTRDRSESAMQLTPSGSGLTVNTFFTPMNYSTLEGADLDFGVTQMLLIPNTNHVITGSKDGHIFLMNRNNMGQFNSGSNNVVQSIYLGSNAHFHSSLSYYRGSQKEYIYAWSENTLLKAYPYNRSADTIDAPHAVSGTTTGPTGNSGAFLSVSSNGSVDSTAILWATHAASGDANQAVRPGILHAFSATDITKELWNSSLDPSDNPGNYAKFNNPTVANGKVYLATFSNQFCVYGLTGYDASSCGLTDIAQNKPAYASTYYSTFTPSQAFDGNATTRWSSVGQSDPQWIYVDLGQSYDVCRVVLHWETALGKNFTIDISDDAVNWTNLTTVTNNVSYNNYFPEQGSGRYVRMYGTARGTNFGYSLYSFEVYGNPTVITCNTPDSLATSDNYETTATLHWRSTGAANYNIQYKSVSDPNYTTISSDTSQVTISTLDCGTDYLFRVQSVCDATDTSSYSQPASFSTLVCGSNCDPLPTRWTTFDVGNTDLDGSACYDPSTFTLTGSGDDIGGTTDAFRFALKTLNGDGEYDARVATLDNANPQNKLGLMIRETSDPGSKFVFVGLTSGTGAVFEARTTTDGATSTASSPVYMMAPYWVRLIKTGSLYSALVSADGVNYINFGTINAGFGNGEPVYAGLAITSHDNTILSTGTVDNFSFSTGILPVKLLAFTAAMNPEQKVDIKWSATQAINTRYFLVQRSNDDKNFVTIDSVAAIASNAYSVSYTSKDNSPANGNNFYRLKIIDGEGNISYSAMVMVRINNDIKAPFIYPNPAKSVVNVQEGSDEIKYITIYDIVGKSLVRINAESLGNTIKVSTSNLISGIYIIEITTTGEVYRNKLLIQ